MRGGNWRGAEEFWVDQKRNARKYMKLTWEVIGKQFGEQTERAKVPGGWLIKHLTGSGVGLTYMPDPDHEWDGSSLP